MKMNEVKIGETYGAKVTGKPCLVKILGGNRHGGWDAINLATNKTIRIKSAQRLNRVLDKRGFATKTHTPAKVEHEPAVAETPAPAPAPAPSAKPERKMSGLDAAAEVLQTAKECDVRALNIREIFEQIVARNLWTSTAPTPMATLTSAIVREIKVKGPESRFRRTERGKFEFAK